MINYIKARMSWRQISLKLGRSQRSVSAHWYVLKKKDFRAQGVEYNPIYDPEIDYGLVNNVRDM